MEYRSDSSGTDDDLPPGRSGQSGRMARDDDHPQVHSGRMTRGGRISGNGRAGGASAHGRPQALSIDQQIRKLELDAYLAVLRAFGAQSEAITWAKERLMSDLRKELRVPDEQHRELLGKVASDDTLQQIRQWRSGEDPGPPSLHLDPTPSPAVSQSRKKPKTAHVAQTVSTLPPPPAPPTLKPAPTSAGPLPSPASGVSAKGRGGTKTRSNKGTAAGPRGAAVGRGSGRGPAPWSNSKGAGPSDMLIDPWIGRRVKTRWPDDNTFYEAVVTDFDPIIGAHSLVYDIDTPRETWEWIDLKGMDKKDLKWIEGPPVLLEGKGPPLAAASGGRGAGRGLKRGGRGGLSGAGRAKGGQRGRPAASHEKTAPIATAPQPRPWRGGAVVSEANGLEGKGVRTVEIQIPDVTAFVKEADALELEEDLEKLETAKRTAKETEEMLRKALVDVGESSDDAGSGDGRHHQAPSLMHSMDREKERHSRQDSGERHADSDDEEDTAGDGRVEGSEGNHGVAGGGGAASDAEIENAEEVGEGDDDR